MTRIAQATYRLLLRCYPAGFREEYGGQMELAFAQQLQRHGASAWVEPLHDVFTIAPAEHFHTLRQDLRYALRSLAANRRFALAAILSLGIGIGANTAIYSLWNNLLHAPLPLVKEAEQLVILTDPTSMGSSNGSDSGDREWLTYAEFIALRGHVDAFSGMMASEASLDEWEMRTAAGAWERMTGRLVSGNYFDFLGVAPAMGLGFTANDEGPYAVISHDFWQNRWNGRADILGQPIQLRGVTLTIVGVAPPGFIGETNSQNPDVWIPLSMQPKVILGEDRLHDVPPSKFMWLHVFGRLKSGATIEQASAQTGAIFKNGLESFYGGVSTPEARRERLNQRLALQHTPGGASPARGDYATTVTAMLAAAATLLLIACANLTNLMLARGTARRSEIALRLSLGASRVRLFRQSIVESATLAGISAAVGLAMAGLLHGVLLRTVLLDRDLRVAFSLDARMLAFTLGVTAAVTLLLGILPAWQAARSDVGDQLKANSRSVTNRLSGRVLVSVQIALCLPLLVCAGLFVRTLWNLEAVDVGYPVEGLLQVQVNTRAAGYEPASRDRLMANLLTEIRHVPGVQAASFSHNGVFTGTRTSNTIHIEGSATQPSNRQSSGDFIAPGYFAALKLPILAGRAITDADANVHPLPLVVNETFAKNFFPDRSPIGQRVTIEATLGNQLAVIIGVVKDSRTDPAQLRAGIRPRYYSAVVGAWLGPRLRTNILIRVEGETGPVLSAVRSIIERADPGLPVMSARPVGEMIDPFFQGTRSMAQLAMVFGVAALLLAAAGLYGVLSYGIARRTREIAIRMALGARPKGVTGMILRETSWVVVAGLIVGVGLAYGASRFVTSELFGVTPQDPITSTAAIGTLLVAALVATLWPSYRASRLDPMTALRQE